MIQITNKKEKIIYIFTNFQINVLKEITIIFIDGTFKIALRAFYQILNIVCYLEKKDLFIPTFSALITSKTKRIYSYTLIEFKKLINNLNTNIDF